MKIQDCEEFCIEACLNKSNSSDAIPWTTNNDLGPVGSSVSVKPGSLIYMTIFNEISLSNDKDISNFTYSIHPSLAGNKNLIGLYQYSSASPTVLDNGFPMDPSEYVSTIKFNLLLGATAPSRYQGSSVSLQNVNNFYGIIAKNLLIFKEYPTNYDINSSIPINPDILSTVCHVVDNNINISNPKKMSCSEGNSIDNYINYPENQKIATSKAYNFGTDSTINYHGGYVRNNINSSNLETNNIKFLSDSTVSGNKVVINGDPKIQITETLGSDTYLQVKVSDKSCSNRYADIDIYQENVKVFAISNLQITDNYSIEEIPLYKNSSIEIKTPSCSASCSSIIDNGCNNKIILNSKSYLDIELPNSGFVQFKMMPINSSVPQQNCKLYARIINPDGNKKLITKSINYSSSQNYNTTSSNPDPSNLDLDFFGYGVFNFVNSNKSDIAISTTCSSSTASRSGTCQNGNGGIGGGGGNVGGLVDLVINSSGLVESGSYRLATSYVNTQFINIDSLSSSINSENGIGQDKSAGLNGVVIFESYNEITKTWTIQNKSSLEYSYVQSIDINSSHKCLTQNNEIKTRCLKFTIIGGAGGASKCIDYNGAKGYNGDRFSGLIDFSDFADKTLYYRNGKGGINQCNSSSISGTTADNYGDVHMKGSYGTYNYIGHGGSASYIYYIEGSANKVFLAISAGGNGGSNINIPNKYPFPPSNRLESDNSNFGWIYKYTPKVSITEIGGPSVSSAPNLNDFDNYHEYDYNPSAPSSDRDPFLPFLNVWTDNFTSEFFARKGQIIRIYPEKSFYNQFWNSGRGFKECGVGMVIKITPRPAVLCYNNPTSVQIPNPDCLPNIPITMASDGTVTTSEQQGCAIQFNCDADPRTKCGSPLNKDRKSCYEVPCSGGDKTTARTCLQEPTNSPMTNCSCATTSDFSANCISNNGTTVDNSVTNATCLACRTRRRAEGTASPNITVNIPACYYFGDNRKLSVHKFFKYFDKSNVIPETSFSISTIGDYPDSKSDGLIRFGKFPGIKMQTLSTETTTSNVNLEPNGKVFGLFVKNSDFKNLTFSSPAHTANENILFFDFFKPAIFSNGEYLNITLCKESSDTSTDCNTNDNAIANTNNIVDLVKYNPTRPPSTVSPQYIKFGYLKQATKVSDLPSNVQRCTLDESNIDNKNYICFANDLGSDDQSSRYRMSFKIIDSYDNDYSNNSGNYSIKLTVINTANNGLGLVNKILDIIMPEIHGSNDNPTTTDVNEFKPSLSYGIYSSIINTVFFKRILQMTVILLITFYGLGYLIGINEMKHSEIVKILMKIGIVFVFTSPSYGWPWFETFFIRFFINSIDMLTFLTAQIFENSQELASKLAQNDFSNKGILFLSVDRVLDTLISSAVQNKVTALIFSSIWGWVYFLIMVHSILLYFYAIANSVLLYITCQVINSILLSLAPIFFIMIFFNITKDIFDNWLKALIGFSLQQIFLIITLSFFNIMFLEFLKYAIGYRICWQEILSFKIGGRKISLAHFWNIAGTNSQSALEDDDIDESFGNDENTPSIYSVLTLWIMVGMMKKFLELFTNLAVSLSGGIKASSIGSGVKEGGQQIFGAISGAATKLYNMTAGRLIQNVDKALFDSGKLAKEEKKAKQEQFNKDMKARAGMMMAGNKAVSQYKKDNALALSTMSRSEQKQVLQNVREQAMERYAIKKNIKNHKELLNKTGLNYQGTNLFGAVLQAGKQTVSSGGNIINSGYDRTVKTTFTKSEASEAIMKMKTDEERNLFIKNIEDGNINVSRGKIDAVKDSFFMFKDAVSGSSKKDKDKDDKKNNEDSVKFKEDKEKEKEKNRNILKDNVANLGNWVSKKTKNIKDSASSNNKKEAIDQLIAEGKIKSLHGQKTGIVNNVVNWTRSDKEKKLIRDRVREIKDFKKTYSDESKKKTSSTVIKDLKNTATYAQDLTSKSELSAGLTNVKNRFSPNKPSNASETPQISQSTIDKAQKDAEKIKENFKEYLTPEEQKKREKQSPNRLNRDDTIKSKDKVAEELQPMKEKAEEKLSESIKKFDEIRASNPAIQIIKDIKSTDLENRKDRKDLIEKINEKITGNNPDEDKQLERLKKMVEPGVIRKLSEAIADITPSTMKKVASIAYKVVSAPIKAITPKPIKDKFDQFERVKNLEERFIKQDPGYADAMRDYKIAKTQDAIIGKTIKLNEKK
jgi:type IV secretory pathway VirB6-like protein